MEQEEKGGEGVKRRLGASLKRMISRARHDHALIPTRASRRRCAYCGKMGNVKDMRVVKDYRYSNKSYVIHTACLDRVQAAQYLAET